MTPAMEPQPNLTKYLWWSLAAAVTTIGLKSLAAVLTGSVGFLSDAFESGVNLVAAIVALWAIRLSSRPPDAQHHFGHGNAEYLSAAVEGGMIFVAATVIVWTSIQRLINPIELEQPSVGLALSGVASLINLGVGLTLVRVGRAHRSITLEADGTHLLTDVVTSAGVLVGIALVAVTNWTVLDPIIPLLVGVNILWTGWRLVNRSVIGLLDTAIDPADARQVDDVLGRFRAERDVDFHAVRTRQSGRFRFVYVDALVPDLWTVKQGHDLAEDLTGAIAEVLPDTRTFVHVEPRDDPASYVHPELPEPLDPPAPSLPAE